MTALNTLTYVTRWWTPLNILQLGCVLASAWPLKDVVQTFANTLHAAPPTHVLVLLYVLDACMKKVNSDARAVITSTLLSAYLPRIGGLTSASMSREVHALAVHWLETGVVTTPDMLFPTATAVFNAWPTHGCGFTHCAARFVSAAQRDVHMDFHFDERLTKFARQDSLPTTTDATQAWLVDESGVMQPVYRSSFFATRRERVALSRQVATRETPRLGSPLPTYKVPVSTHNNRCVVCGDALPPKRYDDDARQWMYDDVCIVINADSSHSVRHAACSA